MYPVLSKTKQVQLLNFSLLENCFVEKGPMTRTSTQLSCPGGRLLYFCGLRDSLLPFGPPRYTHWQSSEMLAWRTAFGGSPSPTLPGGGNEPTESLTITTRLRSLHIFSTVVLSSFNQGLKATIHQNQFQNPIILKFCLWPFNVVISNIFKGWNSPFMS